MVTSRNCLDVRPSDVGVTRSNEEKTKRFLINRTVSMLEKGEGSRSSQSRKPSVHPMDGDEWQKQSMRHTLHAAERRQRLLK